MASEDTADNEAAPKQLSFKIKTSGEGAHNITISETAQVLELKNLLSGEEYENVPASRQRLIYSGRVMKDEEQLKVYKIKDGNTVHMVKSAASNAAQKPASTTVSGSSSTPQATGVPTNMAAGTANDPLAGLTGARYAGHMGLPGMDMFGADAGVSHLSATKVKIMLTFPDGCTTKRRCLSTNDGGSEHATNAERSS